MLSRSGMTLRLGPAAAHHPGPLYMTATQPAVGMPALPVGEFTVALAGNPNVGKTTLFNAITGLKQKVANYPGVTVEKKTGRCDLPLGQACTIIDLPGTYSLASRSPDEHVARQVILGQIAGTPRPDVIVVVCDASNLERNLFLVTQVLELGRPTVVALTMLDVAEKAGRPVNAEKLAAHLRTPVIPLQAHKGKGIDDLKKAIAKAAGTSAQPLDLPLPELMTTHVNRLKAILEEENLAHGEQAWFDAHLMLSTGDDEDVPDARRDNPRVRAQLKAATDELTAADMDPIAAEIEAHYGFISTITADVVVEATPGSVEGPARSSTTDKIDRILTHKILGMAIFVAVMGLVFVSIFLFAKPIMDFLQEDLVGGLGSFIATRMADGPLKDLLVNGIIAGVGNVVVFLPQIALLFLFIAILEDSGYMSRAAFLMDRVMSKVGLHGKSFIPLLSGYACAIPAIMGTRVIENRRDRLATILVLPLMSCSARLPVYALMIAAFFGAYSAVAQGGILLAMYALGTLTAFAMAFIFKRTLLKGPPPAFILEMPPYRFPHWKTVITTVAQRCWHFLFRAGTIIFAFSVLIWAATTYPKPSQYSQDYDASLAPLVQQQETLQEQLPEHAVETLASENEQAIAALTAQNATAASYATVTEQITDLENARHSEELANSFAGRFGRAIAPVFQPLGFDWKLSIGVVGAFFAREVIVSTLGIVYSVGEVDETSAALQGRLVADYSPLIAVSVMVFIVLCMQCLPTLAVAKRETGHWKWPLFMFIYMTALAYVGALIVYQGGRALGF